MKWEIRLKELLKKDSINQEDIIWLWEMESYTLMVDLLII